MTLTSPSQSAYSYPLLIRQLLSRSNLVSACQEIVSGTDMRLSYAEFNERIGRLANTLKVSGIGADMRIGVMDWDSHRYLECFFAVPMMGAVLHTINVRLSPAQVLYTINHGQPDLIIVHEDFMPLIDEIKSGFEQDVTIIPIGNGNDYEDWIGKATPKFDFPDFDENKPATLFYTTGTTGNPKGVSYSHRQLVLHTLGLVAGFGAVPGNAGFQRDDVYMPLTPLFHVHGWGFPYAATLLGLRQVYPGRYTPGTILQLIVSEDVTFSHCVPAILSMLLDHPDCQRTDLSRWKVIIGGAALPRSLQDRANAAGISLHAAYGMSETCPFLTVADLSSDDPDLCAQTGYPGPLVDLRVVTPDMADVPNDGKTTGEVVVRSPWLTQGYIGDPEASDALWGNGYLHTGDVGYMRENGSLQITDRLKDVIKSGGEWISSLELEDIVSRCDGVHEVAALGIPDARWGERPMIVVVKADPVLCEADIRSTIEAEVDQGRLSKWAIPERIVFADELPKTSVGKVNKKAMRSIYGDTSRWETESDCIKLLLLIRESLKQRESHSKGVTEVLAGMNRHLDNSHMALAENPLLPADRAALLDQSIASINESSLQPLAEQIRLTRNKLTWRGDYGLFYPEEADVGQAYRDGNMHTELIGPNGCVFHDDDFSLGIFTLAPRTFYRDHDHAAPELYFNLTGPCGWRFDKGLWQDFGAGSLVWNPEGLAHAMRTYEQPFLSVYSWTSHVNSLCRVVPADDWQEIEAQLANPQNKPKFENSQP